jgi:excisionase family DNA binding protein
MEKLLSAKHVADHLGMHVKTLYKMLRENRIPLTFVRLTGNKMAFRPADIERFLSTRDVNLDGSGPVRKKKPKEYGWPEDPKLRRAMLTAQIMTNDEAEAFFSNARRDKDGRIIGTDPDHERDPWDGEHSEDCRCALCRK